MDEAVRTVIEEKIKSHPIVVFMKGTKNFPQCGFSASVVEVFKRLGASIHDVKGAIPDDDANRCVVEDADRQAVQEPRLKQRGAFL